MMEKLTTFLKNNKDNLFPWTVVLYIYGLYVRGIYLSYESIYKWIDNDYRSYLQNKQQWLLTNPDIRKDVFVIAALSIIILISLSLLHKKNRYFYAVLLLPLFLGLAFVVISPLYMLLNLK